ncbi:MAG: chromosomal replication initiator protein DnaA [Gemmatimonadota bacterium]|nr:MAG: chromosomal replication initiator protein DnaA [Gemmatimonadota bacterium]
MELTAQEAWSRILESARARLPEQTFRTWLGPTKPVALTADDLVVSAPSDFAVEWIESKYSQLLRSLAKALLGEHVRLTFESRGSDGEVASFAGFKSPALQEFNPATDVEAAATQTGARGLLGTVNPRYTLETFVVGSNNELAAAACQAVADAPGQAYNPLFIYSGVGLGKTHLMHGIANAVLARFPRTRVAYLPTEQFTNELIGAIQARRTTEFHNKYRRIDLLLVDDAHFLAGKERTQEEFFHTFNALYDAQKQIVLASDRPPNEIPELQERLVSRFAWGLVTDMRPPEFETRVAILQMKAERDNLALGQDVINLIAQHCRSSVRELEGALIKLLAYSSLTHRDITEELALEILGGVLGNIRDISPEQIEGAVADAYGVAPDEMKSKSRQKRVAEPRQVAMYFQKDLLDLSYTTIGRRFGGRDHSTVIHSIRKVEERAACDPEFRQRLSAIRASLR